MDIPKLQSDLLFSHDRTRSPAADAISSFNLFMDLRLPYIISEFSKFEVVCGNDRHTVKFGDVIVHKPLVHDVEVPHVGIPIMTNEPMMPMEARNRGLTYAAEIFVNIEYNIYALDTGLLTSSMPYREVPLMQMPVMVRSNYCHLSDLRNMEVMNECMYDPGGYFIFNGNEKVMQPQKVQRHNCHVVKQGSANNPIDLEVRSVQADKKFRSTSTFYVHYSGTPFIFTADVPYLAHGHNIVLLLRALGLQNKSEIEAFLWQDPQDVRRRFFAATLSTCFNTEVPISDIFLLLGHGMYNETDLGTPEKIRKQVAQQITGELLPHCGSDDSHSTRLKKLFYLRLIIHHMLDVFMGLRQPDDRDFEGFKTVHMSATLLSTLFRQLFSSFVKNIRNKMFDRFKKSKHLDIAAFVAHNDTLTRDILKAFADGEMTVRQASNAGSSVIQIVHRINPLGLVTDLQKVRTPLPPDGKYINNRGVDPTQMFSYCPAETPEGHGAGLLQNLTLFARIRLGTENALVSSAILTALPAFAESHGIQNLSLIDDLAHYRFEDTLIFINGEPLAFTRTPESMLILLRLARRNKVLPIDCSVIKAHHGIAVWTDMGTVQFPLICLETLRERGHELLRDQTKIAKAPHGELFQFMLSLGIIEYVESWEALDYRIAFKSSDLLLPIETMPFTHIALHPMAFLGTSASTVPWSDHDQAPRVSYQAGMLKQAISCPATNLNQRFDQNYAYSLWYPQKPMADTIVCESRKINDWPMGENLMIAIASYEGLSQEDAIVRNMAAVERGSGRITVQKVYKAVLHKLSALDFEAFECPIHVQFGISCIGIRAECDYSKLDVGGLLTEGTHIRNGDVLIGRVLYTSDDSGRRVRRDRSIILSCEESEVYIVDKIMISTNRDGLRQVRIRIRTMRIPQAGDKISDRHGQKGVIGFLARQEDMPFVAEGPNAGMVPDAIVNLHSINGRMTIGKLLEMLYSNLGLSQACFADATPFQNVDAQWAMDQLRLAGYGTEVRMTNGKTGEPISTPWFIGSCFYQSLKHMVLDKIAARNRGPRATLTRQPMEGRAKQGGLRVGEMERDAFLAHGASMTLDDRSRVASDGHKAPVCTKCGQIGEMSTIFKIENLLLDRKELCRICNGPIQIINTTYCYSNLLVRELATAGIKIEHRFLNEGTDELSSELSELCMEVD